MEANFISHTLDRIENTTMSISQWMLGFSAIVFIRFLFEALSSPTRSGVIASDPQTIIHYGLFWLTIILGTILIVGFFSKNYLATAKMALFGLPVIWLAPIFDILISHGMGFTQSYILDTGRQLFFDFLTFFGPTFSWGATYGIRIELIIVLFGIGWYLQYKEKSIREIIVCIVSVYIFGFIVASWPAILYTFTHLTHAPITLDEMYNYIGRIVFQSNIFHNTLHEGASSVSASRFSELGFDKFGSQVLFIVSCVLSGLLLWNIDKKKFKTVIKNIRLERVGSYIALLICGMGFAYVNNLGSKLTAVDILGVLCLIIAWVGLWMNAVHNNDVSDVKIDEISNLERPLVKKEIDEKSMKEIGYVWLAIGLLGAWSVGFYPFFMSLVYLATSYIYSMPPLRLRQFPLVPSLLIGIASLSTILSGFFFISVNKEIYTFPMFLAAGIVIMATLAINVKDMKDVEGDKANGILTLPVLFPKNGTRIVALCFSLSFLLVPIFLRFYFLYLIALPAAYIGYKLVMRKPYKEQPVFILRFIFLAVVVIVYGGIIFIATSYKII